SASGLPPRRRCARNRARRAAGGRALPAAPARPPPPVRRRPLNLVHAGRLRATVPEKPASRRHWLLGARPADPAPRTATPAATAPALAGGGRHRRLGPLFPAHGDSENRGPVRRAAPGVRGK